MLGSGQGSRVIGVILQGQRVYRILAYINGEGRCGPLSEAEDFCIPTALGRFSLYMVGFIYRSLLPLTQLSGDSH